MDGLMALYKPAGFTSHDVVARVRRLTRERSVGHTGTLDPEATGVLVLCLGRATRLSRFLMDMPKVYEAEIVFGSATTTGDSHGQVVARMDGFTIPREAVVDALHKFTGEIMQVPPMVSAVHYEGRRLYELAREGITVEREARRVTVYGIVPVDLDAWPEPIVSGSSVRIAVECSKGTYIRTLCEDICASLGVPGHMGSLVRTRASGFSLEECATIEAVAAAAETADYGAVLHPMARGVAHLPRLMMNDLETVRALNGNVIRADAGRVTGAGASGRGWTALFDPDGSLAAVAWAEPGGAACDDGVALHPKVVLGREAEGS